jgi:hypothetical protein
MVAMKEPKIFINSDGLLLYVECPVEPKYENYEKRFYHSSNKDSFKINASIGEFKSNITNRYFSIPAGFSVEVKDQYKDTNESKWHDVADNTLHTFVLREWRKVAILKAVDKERLGDTKLLPCPFCGSAPEWINEAKQDSHYHIHCPHCQFTIKQDRRDKVIGFWNNRAVENSAHSFSEGERPIEINLEDVKNEPMFSENEMVAFGNWCIKSVGSAYPVNPSHIDMFFTSQKGN